MEKKNAVLVSDCCCGAANEATTPANTTTTAPAGVTVVRSATVPTPAPQQGHCCQG